MTANKSEHRMHYSQMRFSRCISALAFLTLSGCSVGPDFSTPQPPNVESFTPEKLTSIGGPGKDRLRLELEASVPQRWWETFHNDKLNKLIAAAIEYNPSIDAAEAAIKVAYFNAEAQKGAFLPTAMFGSNSQYYWQNTVMNFQNGNPTNPTGDALDPTTVFKPYGLFLKQMSIIYNVDIWGANRRSVESLEAQTDQQRYLLEAIYIALTSNVAAAAVTEATLRGQIAAIQRVIVIEKEILQIIQGRVSVGSSSQAEFLMQQTALGQAMQMLPPLEKQLSQQRNLLTALAGQYSTAQVPETFNLDQLELPKSLPVSLPSTFVRQRPDIRAAEANMHAAAAQIGVAIAARLPNLTLAPQFGYGAFNFAQIFVPASGFYILGGAVAHTLFDGFSLLNQQKAAEAGLVLADAQYRQSVILAFQNVTDALRALQADTKAVKAARFTEDSARKNLTIASGQLKIGSISQIELLNAQQAYLTASVATVQAEGSRLADVVGLFMALGGGWRDTNLRDLPSSEPGTPTNAQIESINGPVNSSWFPSALN
jgi:NodT family efflux transporter outer membrane factor (OMF) lipoprotein